VATKYPCIAKKFFSSSSVQAEIIKLYGSVELAAVTNMSDCIVDIVSTGGTLRENGLSIIETLFTSTARIVVNRAAYYMNLELINSFIGKIQAVL
jgi:ATP phosphoribosyltransferase